MITLDKFIATGKSHFICQDYILSGPDYVILSDGCSGCANTDIGARILCLSAADVLETWRETINSLQWFDLGQKVITQAKIMANSLFLNDECLAATLMIIFNDFANNTLHIFVYGDGYVFLEHSDHILSFREISFIDGKLNNKPFYLAYYLTPQAYQMYEEQGIVQRLSGPSTHSDHKFDHPIHWTYTMDDFKTIVIASDGIDTFDHKPSTIDIARECVKFKTTSGYFLQRRMIRAIKNFGKKKIYHQDDITIGGFHREDEE